ncbi:solute carrier family 23 protein [Saxibacter everestensis]|uniref:Solute carrier family 23 protein n=1 Tax=Saxibacter everestensis TaxID=2909229 RepID=A0ABY8QRJ6_9MICO|nr:solute carrier family 23 protein [Brevibacteriaceae bacterium ZFBP1038]
MSFTKTRMGLKPPGHAAHPVDEVLPVRRLVTLGLQHVLVMYAGAVAVPLILGSTLGLDQSAVILLINANLITSGVATLIQTIGVWKFGARMPFIQGTSFIALSPMLLIGQQYGLPFVFGSVIAAGLITIGLAPIFSRLLRYFSPVVIGSLITIVGIALMPAAAGWLGGGVGAADFGSPRNLTLGLLTVVVTIFVSVKFKGFISSLSVIFGLIVGTAVAIAIGATDFSSVAEASWFGLSAPLALGIPQFSVVPILVMTLAMLIIMAESTGNVLALGKMVDMKIDRRRLTNALRADGLSTFLGGMYNSFPLNVFSQNTGLVALTRVRSRYVVAAAGVIMILMGLFPKLGAIIAAIPPAVLGGSAIVMFGMTTAAGIQELARVKYAGTHNGLIAAVSISVGVLPVASTTLFEQVRGPLQLVLSSGIFLGGITAVALNAIINRNEKSTQLDDVEITDMPVQQEATQDASGLGSPVQTETELSSRDLELIRKSIAMAQEAKDRGRHPFASLVADQNGLVVSARGNNSMPPEGDPTQHAELTAAAEAATKLTPDQLAQSTLYTSAEPCAMCAGAIYWTGIGRVVYALSEHALLRLTGDNPENPTFALPCREVFARGQREIEVVGPLLEDEAAEAHTGFWK